MPRWTWLDIGIYFGLIAVEIPLRLGICGTIMVWFRVVLFALGLLPLRILLGFSLITFRCRDPFAQHATLMEFTTIQCARWAFETFRPETMSEVLFGKGTFKVMHKFRRFLFGTSSLGDNVFVDVNTPEMNGYWVRSLSRATHHYDCIIYFVPGCLMGFVSPWAYIEFAQLVLVGLQQQGFNNPAMFVVDPEYNKCDYKHSFSRVLSGWTYATKVDPSSIHVVMGSSVGGTLLLTLLLQLSKPFKDLPLPSGDVKKPDAMVLVSPIGRLKIREMDEVYRSEAITNGIMRKLKRFLPVQDENLSESMLWAFPAMIRDPDWWGDALPPNGVFISCGTNEFLYSEILIVYEQLRSASGNIPVILAKEDRFTHAWPIVMSFIGRTYTDQLAGIDTMAGSIANLVLMKTIWKQGGSTESPFSLNCLPNCA